MGIQVHLTDLLRNQSASQEMRLRTAHGITDLFQFGKALCQDCILSPCLFNLYAVYIMQEPFVGKIPWRRERIPTPVFWPREFRRWYHLWGCSQTWLSNFHFHFSHFIMLNGGLEEAQAGIKMQREISNTSDIQTTPCKGQKAKRNWGVPWRNWNRQVKSWPQLRIEKSKIMASSPITSWSIGAETMETVTDLIFWGSKNTADCDCSHEN